MKMVLTTFVLTLIAAPAWAAGPVVLPDACGSDKVKFDVEKQKGKDAPAPPPEGKAQIIFIETMNRPGFWSGVHVSDITTRFGIDGAWAGAAKGDSYFKLDIAPGEHHVCSSVQGSFLGTSKQMQKEMIGMATFTAEAGKTYYYELKVDTMVSHHNVTVTNSNGTTSSGSSASASFTSGFMKLDEEEGKYRVKASDLSVWKIGN